MRALIPIEITPASLAPGIRRRSTEGLPKVRDSSQSPPRKTPESALFKVRRLTVDPTGCCLVREFNPRTDDQNLIFFSTNLL